MATVTMSTKVRLNRGELVDQYECADCMRCPLNGGPRWWPAHQNRDPAEAGVGNSAGLVQGGAAPAGLGQHSPPDAS